MKRRSTLFQSPYWSALVVILTMPLSGASVDIYVPSLPAITQYFNTSPELAKLTVGIFLLGYAIFQLLFGPLSDSVGRKKLLIFGTLLYALVSYLVTLSTSIEMLLILRFAQGLAVASCLGVARAVIPDFFDGKEYQKVTNYTTIAWAIGPIVAPFIGGYLQHYFGWRAPFFFLTGYGIFLFLLCITLLKESHKRLRRYHPITLMHNFLKIVANPIFIGSFLMAGLCYGSIIIFNVIGPFLVQEVLNYTPVEYGYVALTLGVGWFIGNFANRLLIHTDTHKRILLSLLGMCLVSAATLYVVSEGKMNLYTLILPTFLIFIAGGMIYPNIYGKALRLFPEMSGTVSAVLGSLFITITSVSGIIASFLKAHNQIDLAASYLFISIALAAVYFILYGTRT